MITTKNKNKTNNGSSALVVSIMCAVIMTIIRQSINNHTDTYAGISRHDEIVSPEIHTVAPSSSSVQGSRNFLDDITSLIADQKQLVDTYIMGAQKIPLQEIIVQPDPINTGSQGVLQQQTQLPGESEYQSFENIKKALSERHCTYTLPIDNTNSQLAPHIQWGLDHCLITVSAAQKVYPNDILTHEMMRTIANRAGFVVKMDYATNKTVARDEFLTFFYALQQHHKIGDLPVVPMSTPLKRSEYIVFLHKIFGDLTQKVIHLTGTVGTGTTQVASLIGDNKGITMTVKEFKEMLISQGKQINITVYDDTIPLTSDIIKKILSETEDRPQTTSTAASIGIDKEMMKQTLSRFIEKI